MRLSVKFGIKTVVDFYFIVTQMFQYCLNFNKSHEEILTQKIFALQSSNTMFRAILLKCYGIKFFDNEKSVNTSCRNVAMLENLYPKSSWDTIIVRWLASFFRYFKFWHYLLDVFHIKPNSISRRSAFLNFIYVSKTFKKCFWNLKILRDTSVAGYTIILAQIFLKFMLWRGQISLNYNFIDFTLEIFLPQ